MRIYILRHGTTKWNAEHLIQGQTDIPLDDFGRFMAVETGKGLREAGIHFDSVYSSPMSRAYATAKLVLDKSYDKPIVTDDRLKELHFGFMDGGNVEEMQQDESSPFRFFKSAPDRYEQEIVKWKDENAEAIAEGTIDSLKVPELLSDLCQRAADFMTKVIEPHAAEDINVLISVHGALSKALIMHILGESDLSKFWGEGLLPNCGMTIADLAIKDGRPVYTITESAAVFVNDAVKNKAPKLL